MIAELESLGSISLAALGTALLLAAAHGAGCWFVPAGKGEGWISAALLLRLAAGLSVVAAAGVVLGQLRWLGGNRPLWLLIATAVLNVPWLWKRWSERGPRAIAKRGSVRRNVRRPVPLVLWIVASVFALITLGPALCPPSGWDELVYHHELPKRWLADGRPAFYSDLAYSGFPSLGEILFWMVAPLEGAIAPRLIVWVCWMVGLALVYRLLARRLANGSALILTLVLGVCGTVLMISANCYVESIQMFQMAAMLHAILVPRRLPDGHRQRAPALLLGVLAGGAVAVKLTGIALLAAPCLWFAGAAWHDRRRWPQAAQQLAVVVVVAGCIALPFYVRPWLATGNPLYPYYAQWFTSEVAQLETSRYHHAMGDAFGFRTPLGFVVAPLLLSITLHDSEADSQLLYDGLFGWQLLLLLVLAGLALAGARRRGRLPLLLWPTSLTLLFYAFWFLTAQQARFLIPAVIALVLLAAAGLQRLRGQARQFALGLLGFAALLSAPWPTAGHYAGSWFTALGWVSHTAYANIGTDQVYLPLVQGLLEHTPEDARVMLLFEHRGYYIPRKHIIGTPIFQEAGFSPPEAFADPERVMELLQRERITHVVMTNAPAGPDQVPGWFDRLEPLLLGIGHCNNSGRLKSIWQSERYVILEVR